MCVIPDFLLCIWAALFELFVIFVCKNDFIVILDSIWAWLQWESKEAMMPGWKKINGSSCCILDTLQCPYKINMTCKTCFSLLLILPQWCQPTGASSDLNQFTIKLRQAKICQSASIIINFPYFTLFPSHVLSCHIRRKSYRYHRFKLMCSYLLWNW